MSDLVSSLGMVFDTVATGVSDFASGFMDDAAKLFDSGTFDNATEAAPAADASSVASTAADEAGAAPEPAPQPKFDTPSTDVAESGGSLELNSAGTAPEPFKAGALNSAATWFDKLTPNGKAILARGVAGGASALMQALSQQHALDFQKKRDEQAREDKMRRGQIPAFGENAYQPKGIIDGARGG